MQQLVVVKLYIARWEVIPTMVGQADMRIVNTAGNTNL